MARRLNVKDKFYLFVAGWELNYLEQAGLKFLMVLQQPVPPGLWDHRHVSPCSTKKLIQKDPLLDRFLL